MDREHRETQSAAATADLVADLREAARSVNDLVAEARRRLRATVTAEQSQREQYRLHALAWFGTYALAIDESARFAERMAAEGRFGETEALLTRIGVGDYLDQIFSGIPMSQVETARLRAFGLTDEEQRSFRSDAVLRLIDDGNSVENRARLVERLRGAPIDDGVGDAGLDETLAAIRREMRAFSKREIIPHANQWHLDNAYIPMGVIDRLAGLGVFGVSIPEDYGGMGLGKVAMCVVSEELSRGYLGVGSLGTRAEIAGELILQSGTDDQKRRFLSGLASGALLATAVFTEPDSGSDLASLRTRATRTGDGWRINGNKTWITHPVRADLMTILARTGDPKSGHAGLSLLLGEKSRGTDADPFPDAGLSGSEIPVLGYRGMKEYELAFEDFPVAAANLLGGEEGRGFRQLMQTFESARIQTAARAVGVAQSALDMALQYSRDRKQFGQELADFPRVADKLAFISAEIHMARQITYAAARAKDGGKRCDLEAGMAKLLAARVAWAAADNAVQIHGGNGFAQEFPVSRLLCDARVLSIFEGASEIQAQVIARRLIETQ